MIPAIFVHTVNLVECVYLFTRIMSMRIISARPRGSFFCVLVEERPRESSSRFFNLSVYVALNYLAVKQSGSVP